VFEPSTARKRNCDCFVVLNSDDRSRPRVVSVHHPPFLSALAVADQEVGAVSEARMRPMAVDLTNDHVGFQVVTLLEYAAGASSTQPTHGYLGSRMITGIGRSVRSW
jgi:hypothetical protein